MGRVYAVLRDYLIVILLAGSLALFVRFFVVEAYRVPSDFMMPAVNTGDLIFVNKLSYGLRFPPSGMATTSLKTPQRGDVVVFSLFSDPNKEYLKRVIGLPGDKVEIRENILVLNGATISHRIEGQTFEEQLGLRRYAVLWDGAVNLPEVTVPENNLFVLGDNRAKGQDSRHWGFLPQSGLKGRAWFVWFSLDSSRLFTRVN